MKNYLLENSDKHLRNLALICLLAFSFLQTSFAQCEVSGGNIAGGPFEFCVDGNPDNVSGISLMDNVGDNSQWIVTDPAGLILGLPPMPGVVNFDEAGPGVCLIWHMSYIDSLSGLEAGNNVADLQGCYDISNSITVVRSEGGAACDTLCAIEGGMLTGGPYEFCVDGEADHVSGIDLSGNTGANNQWVITDASGNILGLPPMPGVVNFDGAGPGVCLIWNVSYEDGLVGLGGDQNLFTDLDGCFSISNSITVVRNGNNGGILEGGPFEFCIDGTSDFVSDITLSGNLGENSAWVITDAAGTILGLPPMPGVVDFDGAGPGVCLIWHLSYSDGLEGLVAGSNTADLNGCYSLSNSLTVVRTVEGASCDSMCEISGGSLAGGPFDFCVDGVGDFVSDITLSDNTGTNNQWVITDDLGNILGLPPMPGVVDFDGAGAGICLIWNVSYEDGLIGLEAGNALFTDLDGCYSISNSISVTRRGPDGGTIGGLTGNLINRTVIANRASGTVSVINNDDNTVLQTFDMPDNGEPMYVVHNDYNNSILVGDYSGSVAAFDGDSYEYLGSAEAGAGVFHMWLSPNNQQLWVNNELDRTISVINPNTLSTTATVSLPTDLFDEGFKPHDVIIMPDNSAAFVTLIGSTGVDYVIKYSTETFEETARAEVGPDPHVSLTAMNDKLYVASQGSSELAVLNRSDLTEVTVVDVPNAHGLGMNQAGTYLYIGNISDGGTNATYTLDLATNSLVGDPVDAPFPAPHNYAVSSDDSKLFLTHSGAMNDKVSIYSLSPTPSLITSVTVENNPFGLVSYSYYETFTEIDICAGDDVSDAFDVSLHGVAGSNSAWLITDEDLNILALPAGPPFDLDGAGPGVCLIWHISYEDGLEGLVVGENADALNGCFDLSNPIQVNRYQPMGGEIVGGPFEFCVDGMVDNVSDITLMGNEGSLSQWVVTDAAGNILGLPPMPGVVDFDEAGPGVCLIWHVSYEEGLSGLEAGGNIDQLDGCYGISNSITVVRTENGSACDTDCENQGGILTGGPFEFCVDGEADFVSGITLSDTLGTNNQWVITDDLGNILGLPPMPGVVNFDEAGPGVCLIWNVSYEDDVTGLEAGTNLFTGLDGCYSISNSITVTRTAVSGGTLTGGPFEFCIDGEADFVSGIELAGNDGDFNQWVITDEAGNILGLPPMPGVVNFDGAGPGVCLIWNLSYNEGLTGLEAGYNVSDLDGCYGLSNSITVTRVEVSGGTLEGGPFEFCIDGTPDFVSDITLSGNTGPNDQWIITDDAGNILGLPPMPGVVDFDGAGVGICFIWHISYSDGLVGLEADLNVADLQGCYDISNSIQVTRVDSGPLCIVSTEEAEFISNINVFPNPTQDELRVQFEALDDAGQVRMSILDVYGRTVRQIGLSPFVNDVRIDVSALNAGTYVLQFQYKEEIKQKKVLIID